MAASEIPYWQVWIDSVNSPARKATTRPEFVFYGRLPKHFGPPTYLEPTAAQAEMLPVVISIEIDIDKNQPWARG